MLFEKSLHHVYKQNHIPLQLNSAKFVSHAKFQVH